MSFLVDSSHFWLYPGPGSTRSLNSPCSPLLVNLLHVLEWSSILWRFFSLLLQHLFLPHISSQLLSVKVLGCRAWPSCSGSSGQLSGQQPFPEPPEPDEPFKRTFNHPVRPSCGQSLTHFHRILKFWLPFSQRSKIIISHIAYSFQNKQHLSQCLFHLCQLNNSYTNKRHHFVEDLFTKIYLHYFTFRRKTKRSRGHISYLHGRSSPQIRFSSNRTAAGPEIKISLSFSLNRHHHLHKMFWKILQVSSSFSYKTLRGKSFLRTSWLNISGASKEPWSGPAQGVNSAVMITSLHLHIHLNTEKEIQ